LLRDAGLRIQNGRNDLTARVENFPIDLMFVRDDEVVVFLSFNATNKRRSVYFSRSRGGVC
jgi:ATP phosphoribosyltransferase